MVVTQVSGKETMRRTGVADKSRIHNPSVDSLTSMSPDEEKRNEEHEEQSAQRKRSVPDKEGDKESDRDWFLWTRDQRFAVKKQEVQASMRRTRIFLLTYLWLWLLTCCCNVVAQVVSMHKWTESGTQVSAVLCFNLLMLTVALFSLLVYSRPALFSQSLALNFVLVLHSILVFSDCMALISCLYPGFAPQPAPDENSDIITTDSESNSFYDMGDTAVRTEETQVPYFQMEWDVNYDVPDWMMVVALFYCLLHVLVVILMDYTRRLNNRLLAVEQQLTVTQDTTQTTADAATRVKGQPAAADLMAYATSPRPHLSHPSLPPA